MDEADESDVFSQEFWDQRYAASQRVWSGRPNLRLVELAADLAPGSALDVGCGEGADVMWLAERGWQATGADVSVVALERARAHAAEAGLADRTSWLHADLVARAELPGDQDLVTAMFVHVPEAVFDRVYTAVAAAVRPGGTLLVAGHHPVERHTDLRNPRLSHLLFAPERVTPLLADGWRVEIAEARTRELTHEQGHGHGHGHGDTQVATDTVVLATRLP
jgi:2-polyprenyl-3-methyl-5-hydroxy-6-metoxy-1,4-benzoquinol methylase